MSTARFWQRAAVAGVAAAATTILPIALDAAHSAAASVARSGLQPQHRFKSACSGHVATVFSYHSGRFTYRPGQWVVMTGGVQNCTSKKLSVSINLSVTAPCSRSTLPPSQTVLNPFGKAPIHLFINKLPRSANGRSCLGSWNSNSAVISGGKTIASRTATFREV